MTGGAMYNGGGSLTVVHSTIATNAAFGAGAGIAAVGGATSLINASVVNNLANDNETYTGPGGGGLYCAGGAFSVSNSILADNAYNTAAGDVSQDVAGAFTDVGHNIVEAPGSSTSFTVSTLVGDAATEGGQLIDLGSLASNGGPTEMVAIDDLSIAAGAADSAVCAAAPVSGVDQRGDARLVGDCDIGAFQVARTLTLSTAVGSSPSAFGFDALLVGYASFATLGPFPTNTFRMTEGATVLGSGPLNADNQLDVSVPLPVGTHTIVFNYAGDAIYPAQSSAPFTQIITQATSTTTLGFSTNPVIFGQDVTLTAYVTPSAATGTVTFKDGTKTLGHATLSAGQAPLLVAGLSVGAHSISASYGATTDATASSSGPETLNGSQEGLIAGLSSSSAPSEFDQPVTFTAVFTPTSGPGAPTGTVTFADGSTTLGASSLQAGVATFKTSTLGLGNHPITATYAGDTDFLTATTGLLQVVGKASCTGSVTSSKSPSAYGESVTLKVTLTPAFAGASPTGTVTFRDGTKSLGPATLAGAFATLATSSLAPGSHAITAVYGGDTDFTGVTTDPFTQAVKAGSLSGGLLSSKNPSLVGEKVTFTATLTDASASASPTGSVTFLDGTTTLGTGALHAGVARFATAALDAGSHSITAAYAGDADFGAFTTSVVHQTVSPTPVVDAGVDAAGGADAAADAGPSDAAVGHDAGGSDSGATSSSQGATSTSSSSAQVSTYLQASRASHASHVAHDAGVGRDAASPADAAEGEDAGGDSGSGGGCGIAAAHDAPSGWSGALGFLLGLVALRRRSRR